MHEYKREKTTLEARLTDEVKRNAHHDDHIRIIDAFVLQVCAQRYPHLSRNNSMLIDVCPTDTARTRVIMRRKDNGAAVDEWYDPLNVRTAQVKRDADHTARIPIPVSITSQA